MHPYSLVYFYVEKDNYLIIFHKQSNRNTNKIQIKIEQTVANNGRPEEDLKRLSIRHDRNVAHVKSQQYEMHEAKQTLHYYCTGKYASMGMGNISRAILGEGTQIINGYRERRRIRSIGPALNMCVGTTRNGHSRLYCVYMYVCMYKLYM